MGRLKFAPGLKPEPPSPRSAEYAAWAIERDRRDREYLASVPANIAREEREISLALEAGKVFVVNGDMHRVHHWECPAIRLQMDREAAWNGYAEQELAATHHSITGPHGGPPMPVLMTRDEVEALPSYRTCERCSVDVSHRRKSRTPIGRRDTRPAIFDSKHLGRSVEHADGTPMGEVVRVTRTIDASGTRVTLETTAGTYEMDGDARLLIVEKVASPSPHETPTTPHNPRSF